ncbi:hypothetical protein EIK77_007889 [Talaromyces pinophilus]|nr:hypothetical protein EIK77_007889 [Talaromyces pinophilus]
MINNFSAAGGNSSVLIEDSPITSQDDHASAKEDPGSTQLVAVSAKSSAALIANINSLLKYINDKKPSLPNLSYTTTARRMHNPFRVMVAGSQLEDIHASLESKLRSSSTQRKSRALQRVGFAFTGQGSQYLGMGRDLLQFSTFRDDLYRFDAISQELGYPSITPLVHQMEGNIGEMSAVMLQVAAACIQMAMARLWQSWGIKPSVVVGHSLGEYADLNNAGVLSEADTIFLVGKRAQLIQDYVTVSTHAMLAVSTSVETIKRTFGNLEYEIACINSPLETGLSGTNSQIELVLQCLSAPEHAGIRKTKLPVPFAFHSSQMQPVLDKFQLATRAVKFRKPKVPVISPLLGEVLTSESSFGTEYLARHCRETVNLVAGLDAARKGTINESTIWIEIGAHPVVSGLLRDNIGCTTTTLLTLQRRKDTWKTLSTSLASLYESGVEIHWAEYHRDFSSTLSVLRLPSYKWDLKEYWMQYVNDWTLYKGDPQPFSVAPALSTTCVHKLVEERDDGKTILVVGEADILREDMDCFVRGRCVNNVPLVTPSIYAEMAFVLGEYLRKQQSSLEGSLVDLMNMDVQRPFVTKTKVKGPQLLRCQVSFDRKTFRAAVEFWSVTPGGKKLTKHAEAEMAFPNAKQAHEETKDLAKSILERMKSVSERLQSDGRVQKLIGKTGYQLVSSLAQYNADFMGVASVLLDSRNREAVATIKFENYRSAAGSFYINPHLIDNLGQPALFIMNANDEADLSKEVFVNHGWSSLHFYKPLSISSTYHSHVRMTGPSDDGMYRGNVIVFEKNEVVAHYRGVKAQGVPRRLMDYIVHMRDDTKTWSPAGETLHARTQGSSANLAPSGSDTTTVINTGEKTSTDSWSAALRIISEESWVPVPELIPGATFADLGVDSLLAVVGVNCPFMKNPELYDCGIEEMTDLYIREIRRRQPHGPYALGGWSVGGIFAYHVAQQLTWDGETVIDLVLIDCPVPRGLDHLPRRYYEYCENVGLLGNVNGLKKNPPKWLIGHFEACVNSLHGYHASPFSPEVDAPRTQIIWACDAIDKHLEPKFDRRLDDPEGLKFLTEAREDFGPSGWESLLPEATISLFQVLGANHFSMMQAEHAKRLGQTIQGFLITN